MTKLTSLNPAANVAVIGATGGIVRAIVDLLAADHSVASVQAFSRRPAGIAADKVSCHTIDIGSETSIQAAARKAAADGPLDLVFVAVGILHRGDELQPEKSMRELTARNMAEVFAVNAIGPALVAKHFLPRLRKEHKTVFAALSARVGSISDNRLGGWTSYRSSKAALNMVLRTLSIEHARRWPNSVVAGLHPGTVDTRLSAPFSSRVVKDKLFTPQQSAGYLLDVIDSLEPEDSGGFFAWDGKRIDY